MTDIENYLESRPLATLILIAAMAIGVGVVFYGFARLLLRNLSVAASSDSPMTTLMLILGTLSIVALIGALFTRDESAFTIAATGMGAFAGALTARAQYVAEERPPAPAEAEAEAPEDDPGGD